MKELSTLFTELGSLIKSRRTAIGLSQDELAWQSGLHLNAIWKIENAKSEIKLSTLIRIFNVLNVKFTELDSLVKKHNRKRLPKELEM